MMRIFHFALFCFLLGCLSSAKADELPTSVQTALARAHISIDHVGLVVWPLDQARPTLALHAEQVFQPASTMKLVTSFAALGLLGPAWTWQTGVYYDGTLRGGVLGGNLYVRGNGDPSLTDERLYQLLHQLRQAGLRRIDGDLVIDQRGFQLDAQAPFDDHPWSAYNGQPAATLFDYNSSSVYVYAEGGQVGLALEPLPPGTQVVNRLVLDNQPCQGWRDRIHTDWQAQQRQLTLRGSWSAQCSSSQFAVTEQDASGLLAGAFVSMWREQGGQFNGRWHIGSLPADARLLLSFPSLPLTEVLYNMNKFSNNVMARNVFLSLSPTQPATAASARSAVTSWLAAQGLAMSLLVLDNGSGLSRSAQITPLDMARLLRAAANTPLWPELTASLPIVAIDGTMKLRDKSSPVAGRAHIKSGTLDNVKAIAGYVTLPDGRVSVVVCFINDSQASAGAPAQDALLDWVYDPEYAGKQAQALMPDPYK